jgi:hypothetical protein
MATPLKIAADIALQPSKRKKLNAWVPISEKRERKSLLAAIADPNTSAADRVHFKDRVNQLMLLRRLRDAIGHKPHRKDFKSQVEYVRACDEYAIKVDIWLARQTLANPTVRLAERAHARKILTKLQVQQNPLTLAVLDAPKIDDETRLQAMIRLLYPKKRYISKQDRRVAAEALRKQDEGAPKIKPLPNPPEETPPEETPPEETPPEETPPEETPRWFADDEARTAHEKESEARDRWLRSITIGEKLPGETKAAEPAPPAARKPGPIDSEDWCFHHDDLLVCCRCDSEICPICLKTKTRCERASCPRLRELLQQRAAVK